MFFLFAGFSDKQRGKVPLPPHEKLSAERHQGQPCLYILKQRKGGGAHVLRKSRRRDPAAGCLRGGAGSGDIDCRDLPGGGAAVSGGCPADRLRLQLLPQVSGGRELYEWRHRDEHRGLEIP